MVKLDMDALRMIMNGNLGGAREYMDQKKQRERDVIEWINDKDNVDLTVYEHDPLDKEKVVELLEAVKADLQQNQQGPSLDPVNLLRDKITDYLNDCYEDWQYDEVHKASEKLAKTFNMDVDEAKELIWEHASVSFPVDQYLNDKYRTLVVLDTGDANYDFSLNQVEPAYNGVAIEDISDEASILWLAKANGYSKDQFIDLMKHVDKIPEGEHPFIKSVYQELENTSSSMNAVVFLGEMSFADMAKAQAEGVTIPKRAICGLYDGWNGASGTVSVELQKDIVVPKDAIFSVAPDCNDGALCYSIDYTCDFTQEVWDTPLYAGAAKAFEPEEIEQAKSLYDVPPRVPATEDTPLGFMQRKFAGAFLSEMAKTGECFYNGMLNRGQFAEAAARALHDMHMRTYMGRGEYQYSEKYFYELLKIAPNIPKERLESQIKYFEAERKRQNGR